MFNKVSSQIIITVIILVIFASRVVSAQAVDPITQSLPYTVEEYIVYLQELIGDSRILFVASPNDEVHLRGNYLGADYLTETFKIQSFSSLSDALEAEEVEMPDAIILTATSVAEASSENLLWIRLAYRHGTVIAFINVEFEAQMAALDIRCGDGRAIKLNPYPVDWVASYFFYISGQTNDVEAVIEAYDNCKDEDDVQLTDTVYGSIGSANNTLDGPMGGLVVLDMLGGHLENIAQFKTQPYQNIEQYRR